MHRLTAGACLALTLSVAACGTTVPLTSTATGAQGLGGEVGQGSLAIGGNPSGGTQPSGGPATLGAVPGQASGVPGSGSTPTGSEQITPAGTAIPVLHGRGVTPTTITIGAAIPTGTEAAGKALGVSGAGSVAEIDMWNAVINDVNRSGGVLGRKLVLYNHSVDFASYVANPQQTYAEVCADFRDDHHVFAAFIYIADPALRKCLGDMGTPFVVYGAFTVVPESAFAEHGGSFLYTPDGLTNQRLAHLMVQSLMARSFTAKWDTANGGPGIAPVKLGLIHGDAPDQNDLYAAYAKELAAYGWKFADTVTISGDVSTGLAATQSAVLKFSAEGITHVFGASAFFLRYAESQHYRPRYAYLPGLGALGVSNSPAAQLKGALTVGWSPLQDVNAEQDPGPTAGAARCTAVMRAAGITSANRQDIKLEYAVCDAVYALRGALTAGGEPSVAGLRHGFEALGSRLRMALTFASSFGPGRHYGVDSVRDMAFDSACGCLRYTSRTARS